MVLASWMILAWITDYIRGGGMIMFLIFSFCLHLLVVFFYKEEELSFLAAPALPTLSHLRTHKLFLIQCVDIYNPFSIQ